MSRDFEATKNFSLKSHKVNWPIVINCQDHFTSSNPVSISPIEANISSTEKRMLQWSYDTGKFSQGGTPLLDENLKLCNGRKIQQRESHMIIQRDASTKGWGAYCKGVSTEGEMVRGGEAFSHKCCRITGIKICNPNFHKKFVTLDYSCSSRQ